MLNVNGNDTVEETDKNTLHFMQFSRIFKMLHCMLHQILLKILKFENLFNLYSQLTVCFCTFRLSMSCPNPYSIWR